MLAGRLVLLLLIALVLKGSVAEAQFLERQTLSATGGPATNSGLQLDQTIGDLVTGSGGSALLRVTHGFDQAQLTTVGIYENLEPGPMSAWPNPTRGIVWIAPGPALPGRGTLVCHDARGSIVSSTRIILGDPQQLDLSELAAGTYSFQFVPDRGSPLKARIEKVD
ncbi:MAG TPA: hypothetical protein PLB89_14735 [Flavobacteriales bacterium]|nr:hypothetical protein [Flavobacteriales bacterium]